MCVPDALFPFVYHIDLIEANIFSNLKGLTYYTSNREDPYITLRDEEDEDQEDLMIQATDNLLLAAKTEDDISHLEVYLYDESEENDGNMYVHHDIMLPAFPLCLEWLDFRVGRKSAVEGPGNYVAVGTFDPEIEIWDLDTIDNMYPDAVLGAQDKTKKKKGAKKSKVTFLLLFLFLHARGFWGMGSESWR
jgi:periodic tryptophan protein 1